MIVRPAGVYTNGQLIRELGLSKTTLMKARRSGALRSTQKGHTLLYRGQWIIDWLNDKKQVVEEEPDQP